MMCDFLESFGSTIRVAYDGSTALQIARDFQPDLALVDIGLPTMDGYELARRLREQQHDPKLRVVAVTGFIRDAEREREADAAFDAHLLKPVHGEKLAQVLHDLCTKQ